MKKTKNLSFFFLDEVTFFSFKIRNKSSKSFPELMRFGYFPRLKLFFRQKFILQILMFKLKKQNVVALQMQCAFEMTFALLSDLPRNNNSLSIVESNLSIIFLRCCGIQRWRLGVRTTLNRMFHLLLLLVVKWDHLSTLCY